MIYICNVVLLLPNVSFLTLVLSTTSLPEIVFFFTSPP